ncbi:hypothetical protein [Shimwellia blattae]|uniref:hypothetical protein n=1 Tax=Shimwellia blattae TaxID=563 RepID=UPI000290D549|nr:hypothetical protein [Shimwellia blattae]GAB80504.1 hypothetical protein EB105725_05_02320 [Shimwellia blattae DSM 4481 = NBRC 105725]VDY64794.1 Uncharacterised protein [Shimwellia blattae]VEC22893.1 Uncharacterised protein [Shimwellia blattae]
MLSNNKEIRKNQLEKILSDDVTDPDARVRERVRIELKRMVNWAALFGVSIPEPAATELEQVHECRGYVLPHRFKSQTAWGSSPDVYPVNMPTTGRGRLMGD